MLPALAAGAMGDQFAIEDVGSMGRRNSPPFDAPDNQLALPGQSGGRGGKYGASPDVRNAVMDYYKSDKKATTANLSALLSTVRTPACPRRAPFASSCCRRRAPLSYPNAPTADC